MKSIFAHLKEINADTAEEMAIQAGLDFTAIKKDAYYDIEEEEPNTLGRGIRTKKARIPDKVAVVREDDNRYLGTVGRERGILQYRDVLSFTEALIEEGKAAYLRGGIIGNGQQAFVVMDAHRSIRLNEKDEIACYFYVSTSHDNSRSLEIVPSPLRRVNNTVLTFDKKDRIKFRHSSKIKSRVDKASDGLKRLREYFDNMQRSFQLLTATHINTTQLDAYLKALVPDPKERPKRAEHIREQIRSIYMYGAAYQLPSTRNTMLGVYLAVTEWEDHYKDVRVSKRRPNIHDAKLHNLLEGTGAQKKADAFAFALKMARDMKGISIDQSPSVRDSFSSL
jgi:phage/plasmid-like protein (TIGR03299 family)